MEFIRYTKGMHLSDRGRVLALGMFDGAHIGHRPLLIRAREIARKRGLTFAVFTFLSESFSPKGGAFLYSTEERLEIFESLGVDEVIAVDFESVASTLPRDFVLGSLITDMRCEVAVAGFDFRFGKGAIGDTELLCRLMKSEKRECVIEDAHLYNGEKISTGKIKELLSLGNLAEANHLLGEPYFMYSSVEEGDGRGRTLGFPTINTSLHGREGILKRGVYRTRVDVDGESYVGLTNVGTCPTFEERTAHAETYILDYDGDLYGKRVKISFMSYLREEKRFSDGDELVMQINVDKNRAIEEAKGDMK